MYSVSYFPIGVAVNAALLQNNATYLRIIETEFNSITSENALKWSGLRPAENKFDFSKGNVLVDFALRYNKRFHGHNLCWYQHNPNWLSNFTGDSAEWESLFKTHIQTVVNHYRGKITSWDVVNEAFYNNGTLRMDSVDTSYRKEIRCLWARHIGKDYNAGHSNMHTRQPGSLIVLQ